MSRIVQKKNHENIIKTEPRKNLYSKKCCVVVKSRRGQKYSAIFLVPSMFVFMVWHMSIDEFL